MRILQSWYDSTQLGGKISAWTLRFHDPQVETAFLASRGDRLTKNVVIGFTLGLVWTVSFLLGLVMDWSSSGGVFVASQRSYAAALVRNILLVLGCPLLLVGIACGLSPVRSRMGLRAFEIVALAVALAGCIVTILANPGLLAKLTQADPEADVTRDTTTVALDTVLYLDVITTCVHMMFPIRWFLLSVQEVTPVIIYAFMAVIIKDHLEGSYMFYVLSLLLLNICAGLAKRQHEILERSAFVQLASEKTRRFQAEYLVESLQQSNVERVTDSDAASNAASIVTAEVFGGMERADSRDNALEFRRLADLCFREHWLIPAGRITASPQDVLGVGGYGMVIRARYQGAPVALKLARESHRINLKSHFASLACELRILRKLRHPNIVLFYGACVLPHKANIALVLELVAGCPLSTFVEPPPARPSLQERFALTNGIACALMYLHSQLPQIVHGDVKDSNVMVETLPTTVRPKLLDFGLGHMVTGRAHQCGGTTQWMAPEVLLGEKDSALPSADTFSFGRLLFTIMTGIRPLRGMTSQRIMAVARAGKSHPLPWGDHVPLRAELEGLCEACTRHEPGQRPSMDGVHRQLEGMHPESHCLQMLTLEDVLEEVGDSAPQRDDEHDRGIEWGVSQQVAPRSTPPASLASPVTFSEHSADDVQPPALEKTNRETVAL